MAKKSNVKAVCSAHLCRCVFGCPIIYCSYYTRKEWSTAVLIVYFKLWLMDGLILMAIAMGFAVSIIASHQNGISLFKVLHSFVM